MLTTEALTCTCSYILELHVHTLLLIMLFTYNTRQSVIEENMRKMPEMIAEYRKRIYELREKTRKNRTEEEDYLLATGKKKQDGPLWQIYKDSRKK